MSAVASVAVALSRRGFALRILSDTGQVLVPRGVPTTEGAILDALAGVTFSRAESTDAASERLRREGIDGVLVGVFGLLNSHDADRLSRLRHGAGSCVAVLLDSETWAPTGPR